MLGILTTACFGGGESYELDAITQAKIERAKDGQRVLSLQVRQASLYACPGVRRHRKPEGDYFTVVRCRVGAECAVDIPASAAPTGESHAVVLPADTATTVYLQGASATRPVPESSSN